MEFYIDENFSPFIASGLQAVEEKNSKIKIFSIPEEFRRGISDEEWIPKIGKRSGVVLSFDKRIHKRPDQRKLYEDHGLGIFFFKEFNRKKSFSYWEMVRQVFLHWEEIKQLSLSTPKPFAYQCICKPYKAITIIPYN